MNRESILIGVGSVLAAMAVGMAGASLFDFDVVRRLADRLSPDGAATSLDHLTNAQIVARLREFAVVTGSIAAALLALRRAIAPFFAIPATRAADADNGKELTFEVIVAGVVLVVGVALAWRNLALPVRSDEALTLIHFAAQPLWTAVSAYPLPNNHVLHTLLVFVTHRLGEWEEVTLRIPAFLAACLALPVAYCFVRREHGWFAAGLATALIATSPLFIEYATNARGYTLLTLFFLLSLLCARTLPCRPAATRTWVLFAVCIALGFFTIPIMAFPAAVTVAWMLIVRWRQGGAAAMPAFLARTAAWSGVALVLALILYAPVLTVSGYDALFNNQDVQGGSWFDGKWLLHLGVDLSIGIWSKWHVATPVWAQAALVAMIALGVAAPRRQTGHCGTFPLAVVLGVAAVLTVKPVTFQPRFTLFLLCASMMIAGAGGASLINAGLARLPTNAAVRSGARGLTVILVLACFSWWATRPGVAEKFTWETGYSPGVQAMVAAVKRDLRPGDVVTTGQKPTLNPIRFYLNAAGHRSTRIYNRRWEKANPCPSIRQTRGLRREAQCDREVLFPQWSGFPLMGAYRIDGQSTAPDAPINSRLFLFVDDGAYHLHLSPRNRLHRPSHDSRTVRRHLDEHGYDYQVIDLPVGKVYRLDLAQWVNAPDNRPLRRDDVSSRGNGDARAFLAGRSGT